MLKFFRKIRHKLLSENRITKYLLYAIGEILLVVIGILIALQVNNANEERKSEKILHQYLKFTLEELNSDIRFFESRHKKYAQTVDYLENLENENYDSIDLSSMFYRMNSNTNTLPGSSSYKSIIENGSVHEIKDDTLIQELSKYYNILCPEYNDWVEYHKNSVWNNIEPYLLEHTRYTDETVLTKEEYVQVAQSNRVKSILNIQLTNHKNIDSLLVELLANAQSIKHRLEDHSALNK